MNLENRIAARRDKGKSTPRDEGPRTPGGTRAGRIGRPHTYVNRLRKERRWPDLDGIRRGQIYLADLDPVIGSEQGGVRPVLVVQNDRGNRCARTVIVAPLTGRARRGMPTHVALPASGGLRRVSTVMLEQVRTIDKTRLGDRMGAAAEQEMAKVDMAIRVSLGLDSSRGVIPLCGTCSCQFREAGYRLSALTPESTIGSPFAYCGSHAGRDYVIVGP